MRNFLQWFARILALVLVLVLFFFAISYHEGLEVDELREEYVFKDSKFIEIEGMPMHYRVTGDGEPIVLIHGTGASLHTWAGWTEVLSKEFKVISMDLPAYGLTGPHPEGKYDLDTYLGVLHEFFNELELDTFSLAGNSFGGLLAWNYAIKEPGKIKKLILLNSTGYPQEGREMPIGFRLAKSPVASQFVTHITPKAVIRSTVKDAYGNRKLVTDSLVDRYYHMLLRKGNRQAVVDKMRMPRKNNPGSIKQVQAHTLIMWGDQDKIVDVKSAALFHKDIVGSEIIIYKNIGHVPMEEIPQRSGMDALAFLKK